GIIHRDIKPSNVLVRPPLEPRLIDFGISLRRDLPRLSHAGLFRGTLAYPAPELIESGVATQATDLYALGVLTAELLIGRNPMRGDSAAQTLSNQLNLRVDESELRRNDVPDSLIWIVGGMLEK